MEVVGSTAQALGDSLNGRRAEDQNPEAFERVSVATRQIIEALGVDPNLEGMKDTPARVARMWHELTAGYRMDPEKILKTTFNSEKYDQMIVLRDISFHSTCEHHLLPFSGKVWVGYLPNNGRVVGISKLARLVDCFSKRFQLQERMTKQIADALQKQLDPKGVGVVVRALHLCMTLRGVTKPGALMETSALFGCFREDPGCRSEFLRSVE